MAVLDKQTLARGFDLEASPELAFRAPVSSDVASAVAIPPVLEVGPEGTPLTLSWRPASGAMAVELSSAAVALQPILGSDAGIDLGETQGAFAGERLSVPIPDGPRPVRSLYLRELALGSGDSAVAIRNHTDGDFAGHRIAVAVELNGVLAPVAYAAPDIGSTPGQPPFAVPRLLTGAALGARWLSLPDVLADKLTVMVVTGDSPEDFTPVAFSVAGVTVRAAPHPVDMELRGPDGAPFWAGAGPQSAAVTVDARNVLKRALTAAVKAGDPPEATLTVASRAPGRIRTFGIGASGALLREAGEKIGVTIEGDARRPEPPAPPLEGRSPTGAVADVVVKHGGLRLHDISDAVPTATGDHAGPVVSPEAPAVRMLPPEALTGETLRRIGVIGYAQGAAKLSVQLHEAAGQAVGPAIAGETATADVAPASIGAAPPEVVWFDLPAMAPVAGPVAIRLAATSGRFHWVDADGSPLVRLAVAAGPEGSEVRIGGVVLTLTGERTESLGMALAPGDFAGALPLVSSTEFCEVVIGGLTLRYAP